MAQSMKRVTELGAELSNEERNLLSVAYKVNKFLRVLIILLVSVQRCEEYVINIGYVSWRN